MQLNISFPATGCQKLIEVDDEKKLRAFYEKRISQEVNAECLGDEWKVSGLNYGLFVPKTFRSLERKFHTGTFVPWNFY